jgi:prepilin peptidase CpaA
MNFNESQTIIINFSLLGLAVAFSLGAAIFDLKYRKIPNLYNLIFFVLALILRIVLVFANPHYLWDGLLACLIGFAILFIPFVLRLGGAGDVKLLAILGLIQGIKNFLWVFVLGSLLNALLIIPFLLNELRAAFIYFNSAGRTSQKLGNYWTYVKDTKRSRIQPYALPVSLGCFAYLLLFWLKPGVLETIESFLLK